ncbi:hypothetical protein BU14_0499s0007 [Porphyra umbilicalis]|uniref:Uncharacterized protein n=1 Tax=Porphyra umbilicalis TaxID=2786 RepID=A0A1X6NTJ9_PORUM|nr:hypothetical protein BU14_0499s0007 [Porphyra umbilicalis]|eukprot:OSX71826.1 hypothetical protein BU14_0499s0007 [Porphyra umbilicalis]
MAWGGAAAARGRGDGGDHGRPGRRDWAATVAAGGWRDGADDWPSGAVARASPRHPSVDPADGGGALPYLHVAPSPKQHPQKVVFGGKDGEEAPCTQGLWRHGRASPPPSPPARVAACGASLQWQRRTGGGSMHGTVSHVGSHRPAAPPGSGRQQPFVWTGPTRTAVWCRPSGPAGGICGRWVSPCRVVSVETPAGASLTMTDGCWCGQTPTARRPTRPVRRPALRTRLTRSARGTEPHATQSATWGGRPYQRRDGRGSLPCLGAQADAHDRVEVWSSAQGAVDNVGGGGVAGGAGTNGRPSAGRSGAVATRRATPTVAPPRGGATPSHPVSGTDGAQIWVRAHAHELRAGSPRCPARRARAAPRRHARRRLCALRAPPPPPPPAAARPPPALGAPTGSSAARPTAAAAAPTAAAAAAAARAGSPWPPPTAARSRVPRPRPPPPPPPTQTTAGRTAPSTRPTP